MEDSESKEKAGNQEIILIFCIQHSVVVRAMNLLKKLVRLRL